MAITILPRYSVVYADPAWPYDNKRTGGSMSSGSAQKYPVMKVVEIQRLPVIHLASPNAVLFLWATVPLLPEALETVTAWGFKYKTALCWHKVDRFGMGFWFRGGYELLLLGVRGDVRPFRQQIVNLVETSALPHSQKPEEFRSMIEVATAAMPRVRRVELFATHRATGWVSIGNEIDGRDIRDVLARYDKGE